MLAFFVLNLFLIAFDERLNAEDPKSSIVEGWIIPACTQKPKMSHSLFFMLEPSKREGTKLRKVVDADYELYYIRFRNSRDFLQIGSGHSWCNGCGPSKQDMDDSTGVSSRDIAFGPENSRIHGKDARGKLIKGGYWRHVAAPFETISYRDVSPAAAAFFDSIIDSVCFQEPRIGRNPKRTPF